MKFSVIRRFLLLALLCSFIPWAVPADITDPALPGTAVFAQATAEKTAPKKKEKYFTLNFKDVEISEFLNVMSQLIGKNIIIDDKIKGKITISSAKKIPVSEAFNVMKSILEVKELAVVETENLIKILPIKEAVKKNVEVILDGKKDTISLDKDKTVTYLLDLKYAEANEIAGALKAIASPNMSIVVYQSLNTIIFSGNSSELEGLVKVATALDKPLDETQQDEFTPKGNIHVIHLENANAEDLANVLARIPFSENTKIDTTPITQKEARPSKKTQRVTKTQATKPAKEQKLSIIANKETNSLIISATPEEMKEIRRIIKELDIVREQVLIEALIVEVGADNTFSFGINWMLGGQSGSNSFGGSSLPGGVSSLSSGEVMGKSTIMPMNQGFQLGYIYDAAALGFALLNATAYDNEYNIISTPQILTIDNQEAELNVGEEVPIQTNTRITDAGNQFYTWDYKSVGIKLKITPHITNQERITLDIYQEANQVLEASTTTDKPPTLGKRDLKTKVTVIDGKTIVIGGLIRNDKTVTDNKVPLLGDIPILGWLFKSRSTIYRKTNLLVFITPHIVTKQDRMDAITRQKRNIQKLMKKR
ncbi:MAG TPA: secretin N-terminal domain-containing protein [Spirochaetota bacterium]|nr:secretin N-terminal domain-containing protein [Spirochaetota bacterium]HPI89180.1 secretin N-terminal domain-containing protein [Spirochaetota bacterium]HPR46825.1 secretin N-terminal domain-containing protein [Spirochaetota bacterium]